MTYAQTAPLEAQESRKGIRALPFVATAIIWGLVGLGVSLQGPGDALQSAKWMIGLWALCVIDLFALANVLRPILLLMTLDDDSDKRPAAMINALFWGIAKFVCLGLFCIALMSAQGVPQRALLTGLSTLLVVPLVGGFLWSQKELGRS
jgi:hypothetical protein